jgi:hypothetical protein
MVKENAPIAAVADEDSLDFDVELRQNAMYNKILLMYRVEIVSLSSFVDPLTLTFFLLLR